MVKIYLSLTLFPLFLFFIYYTVLDVMSDDTSREIEFVEENSKVHHHEPKLGLNFELFYTKSDERREKVRKPTTEHPRNNSICDSSVELKYINDVSEDIFSDKIFMLETSGRGWLYARSVI